MLIGRCFGWSWHSCLNVLYCYKLTRNSYLIILQSCTSDISLLRGSGVEPSCCHSLFLTNLIFSSTSLLFVYSLASRLREIALNSTLTSCFTTFKLFQNSTAGGLTDSSLLLRVVGQFTLVDLLPRFQSCARPRSDMQNPSNWRSPSGLIKPKCPPREYGLDCG